MRKNLKDARQKAGITQINYIDFEKFVFGWQHILRYFTLGRRRQVVADYDPEKPSIRLSFRAPDESGTMKEEIYGSIHRTDCERFILFTGKKFLDGFEAGKKQRVIVDYDPLNEKASIEIQKILEIRSMH